MAYRCPMAHALRSTVREAWQMRANYSITAFAGTHMADVSPSVVFPHS